MSDSEWSYDDETIGDLLKQLEAEPAKVKRRRRSNLKNELLKKGLNKSDLTAEELEKHRKHLDAERKKKRRKEMSEEERRKFLARENERKRIQRLQKSFDVNRAKEAKRKREKRRAMSPTQREAFRAKDAQRKRLARLRKKLELAGASQSEIEAALAAKSDNNDNNDTPTEINNCNETADEKTFVTKEPMLKLKRGRPRKIKEDDENGTTQNGNSKSASADKKQKSSKTKVVMQNPADKEIEEFLAELEERERKGVEREFNDFQESKENNPIHINDKYKEGNL